MTNFSPLSTNGRGGVSGLSEVTGAKKIRAVGSQPVNRFMLSTNQEVLQPPLLLRDEMWRSYQIELLGCSVLGRLWRNREWLGGILGTQRNMSYMLLNPSYHLGTQHQLSKLAHQPYEVRTISKSIL